MSVPKKNPDVILREEEEGKYLVFNPENTLPLVMNKTSYFIWNLCDGQHDANSIKAALSQGYDLGQGNISDEQLDQIVGEHLSILEKAQLISRVEPS